MTSMELLARSQKSAVLSADETCRFQLCRALCREDWATTTLPGFVAWVLNNPSTADAELDDPTVRKCWTYTLRWGYGAMMFVNTNPWRSTDPKGARVPHEDYLLANDSWLRYAVGQCPYVVAAWGDRANRDLAMRAVNIIHPIGPLHALRVTQSGNPQHPLYLPGDLQPQLWKPNTGLN